MKLIAHFSATLFATLSAVQSIAEAKTVKSSSKHQPRNHPPLGNIRVGKTRLTEPRLQHTPFEPRIVGGTNASPGEYPYFGMYRITFRTNNSYTILVPVAQILFRTNTTHAYLLLKHLLFSRVGWMRRITHLGRYRSHCCPELHFQASFYPSVIPR